MSRLFTRNPEAFFPSREKVKNLSTPCIRFTIHTHDYAHLLEIEYSHFSTAKTLFPKENAAAFLFSIVTQDSPSQPPFFRRMEEWAETLPPPPVIGPSKEEREEGSRSVLPTPSREGKGKKQWGEWTKEKPVSFCNLDLRYLLGGNPLYGSDSVQK